MLEYEQERVEQVITAVELHGTHIRELQVSHAAHAADINKHAEETFQNNYQASSYMLFKFSHISQPA